jgi:shikimate kinase
MKAPDVNLYLVGFMGTGKSTIGRAVAHRLRFRLLDSDHEIERQQGRTVPEIFAGDGEPAFRELERAFVESGHPDCRAVVACGGGLVVQPGMLDRLKHRGVVICLHASLETILNRTARQQNRPLLAVDDPAERIRQLYTERDPVYRQSGTLILTDGRSLAELTAHVIRVWRRDAADYARRQAQS